MVLKKSNCSVNSGNTMRPRYYNSCIQPRMSTENMITKFYFNSIIQPVDFVQQNAEILAIVEEYIEDGGMQTQDHFQSPVIYSMNKRYRWRLLDLLKNVIIDNEPLKKERFKMTLCECEDYSQSWYNMSLSGRGYCVGYSDSKSETPHVTPHKHVSYMTDLRTSGQGVQSSERPSRRRRFHNLHKRGLQRTFQKHQDEPDVQDVDRNLFNPRNLAERGGCPEIRYEVSTPATYNSSKKYYLHYCSKKWSYWYYGGRKALCKSKGFRNKPGTGDIFRGYGIQDMRDAWKLELDYPCREKLLVKKNHHVAKKKTAQKINLKPLIEKTKNSKKRKRFKKTKKKSEDDEATNESGYVFVNVDKKIQMKVNVQLISRASSRWTKKYGKGCAIYEGVESQDKPIEEEFVMVESDEHFQPKDQESDEAMELMKDNIRLFNDSFCVCKMFMSEIVPRKLVEVCGSKAEVSFIHPYTFVLDLDGWFLVCQLSPGVGLWPDPESQNVVAVRVILQGDLTDLESIETNSRLHKQLIQGYCGVFKLKRLLDIAKQIVKDRRPIQQKNTKDPQLDTLNHRTIHKHLFSDLTSVQTSRDILEDHQRSLNILPSVSRIDLVELIEIDLGLVEECAICNASWDGEGWSWVSHNVTLVPCKHSFCRQCWQIYLCHNIKQGNTTLCCMEYGCKTEVDPATVASLVPMKLYSRWQQQCAERHVTQVGGWEWCPRAWCQFLAKQVKPKNKKRSVHCRYGFTVRCHCGEFWCFLCRKEAHWPALCSHSDVYHKMLKQNGDDISQPAGSENVTYFVKFKRCPKCHYPMEKNGGCSHMTCRCSHHFCWECLNDWNEHTSNGFVCGDSTKELSTMELDNTTSFSLPVCYYRDSVAHRHTWQHLSTSNISKRASQFAALQRSTRQWAKNLADVPTDFTQTFVKNTLMFVREVHVLLENCSVLLSNTTRACRPQPLVACRTQLAFIVARIEATLSVPKTQRDKMLTRLKSLMYMAWSTIDKLVMLAPQAQELIDAHSKKQQQEVEGSTEGTDNQV